MRRNRIPGPLHRYMFFVPEDDWHSLEALAEQRCTSVAELLRTFIRLGLLINEPDATLIVRQGEATCEVLVL